MGNKLRKRKNTMVIEIKAKLISIPSFLKGEEGTFGIHVKGMDNKLQE